ncbi:response regulator transcription factor [Thermaerobacillus caldiproteolyticus]|uniref:DNA-binding response OmpR family regulator n=1 Tax=Thermaerobacillus caldiproteolyticus TaxID=247480 RepID=A0A7W0BYB2_9BACL|nr:response regulator transcription factor [Anoxybacillus caldiproteolyticus]MBA2875511.1 DNA-binding response OmpR family regulator [Anoxybacillus caldiproteolyticus]QPA32748.1 response regulator transcription factor [Anoxybacillus caldiproteolyticus]
MEKKTVLIVDDEEDMRFLVSMYLENSGFACLQAKDGEEALQIIRREQVDLILLDIMMPKMDGFTLCARIREQSDVPVLFLTARGDEWDKVKGLKLGGDDYIVKPFSPGELIARIEAVMRRVYQEKHRNGGLSFGPLCIDEKGRKVTVDGETIVLTLKEFDLLLFLAKHHGQVFSRDDLLVRVWGYDYTGNARTVDTHIKTLRIKLKQGSHFIKTVWGIGYKFEV